MTTTTYHYDVMNIPSDFGSLWPLSDVVLIAEDASGNKRELHTNRTYLAMYSSFFECLFFSDFKEAMADAVTVSCSYEIMKLILQIIHEHSRDFSTANNVYDEKVLMELYKAADFYDFPAIRKMCIRQMKSQPTIPMAIAVLGIAYLGADLRDTLMDILKKMRFDALINLIKTVPKTSQILFSKNDVATLYEIIKEKPLPVPAQKRKGCIFSRVIPDITENYSNGRVDLTKKWPLSDVLIKTKNSEGNELFSSKSSLAMVSPHFAEMFSKEEKSSQDSEITEIEVDVEFIVMKNILAIIHHCHNNDNLVDFVSSSGHLLCEMLSVANKYKLDIPMIRVICVKGLVKKASPVTCEIAAKYHLSALPYLLLRLDGKALLEWVTFGSECTSKISSPIEDDKIVWEFLSQSKPLLSFADLFIVASRIVTEYPPKEKEKNRISASNTLTNFMSRIASFYMRE